MVFSQLNVFGNIVLITLILSLGLLAIGGPLSAVIVCLSISALSLVVALTRESRASNDRTYPQDRDSDSAHQKQNKKELEGQKGQAISEVQ